MGRALRTIHFAVTVLVGLPLVMWTVTGFAFTCFDFQSVRGTRDRAPAEELGEAKLDVTSAAKLARVRRDPDARVVQVRAHALLGRTTYIVELAPPYDPVLIDGESGDARDSITTDEAGAIARRAFRGDVRVIETRLITSEKDAPAVREPAYRAILDDAQHTQVFVTRTGEILSWRNDSWRRFDRLWSLHVFGFVDRSSPVQWPLRVVGGLAAIAALSGAGLLVVGLARRRLRRAASAGAHANDHRHLAPGVEAQ